MNNIDMLKIQGTPQRLDKTLNEAYIKAIKHHIDLLEAKKRGIENIIIKHGMTTEFANGVLKGLNSAIEQLYSDINQLKDK